MRTPFPGSISHRGTLAAVLVVTLAVHVRLAAGAPSNSQQSWPKGGLFGRKPRPVPVAAAKSRADDVGFEYEEPPQADQSSSSRLQKEQLYEAYNMLHSLAQVGRTPYFGYCLKTRASARSSLSFFGWDLCFGSCFLPLNSLQDFHKPFDAPAVLVVGQQTSGKSALIEALMGFQFNQVGGGTKTRRPIALRMQYNPRCTSPMCFLTLENGKEEPRTMHDIQVPLGNGHFALSSTCRLIIVSRSAGIY